MKKSQTPRPYRQTTRAEAAKDTLEAILNATRELTAEKWLDELTLDEIAGRAGVASRTVFRKFGSRDELITAMANRYRAELEAKERKPPAPGAIKEAIGLLVESYERDGQYNLRGLAQEMRWPFIQEMFKSARARHRRFVQTVFEPDLQRVAEQDRPQLLAQLEVATWMTTWKYFRIDLGFSKQNTGNTMLNMVKAILNPHP